MEIWIFDILQNFHKGREGFRVVSDDEVFHHKQRVCIVYCNTAALLLSYIFKINNPSSQFAYATIILSTKFFLAWKTKQSL